MHRINHYLTPITLGLVIALWVLQLFPNGFREQTPTVPDVQSPVSSYADSVSKAIPAVVNIYTTKTLQRKLHPLLDDPFFSRFFGITPRPRQKTETSLGSGVILHSEGFVITNNHVIEGADEILVLLQDGRTSTARVIGTDPDTDLALLKIHLKNLPIIDIAQGEDLRVGDVVLAIGNPFGFGQTVTLGIVSATGRHQVGIAQYENFIQTDAAINPGNSGGALVNAKGELVGINTAIFSKSGGSMGIGFAIPVNSAIDVIEHLAQHGRVIRGWLGVDMQPLSERYRVSLNLPDELDGLIVTRVGRGSPGEQSGLIVGDIVTHIDGVSSTDRRKIKEYVAQLQPGAVVDIRYIRLGLAYTTQARLAEREGGR